MELALGLLLEVRQPEFGVFLDRKTSCFLLMKKSWATTQSSFRKQATATELSGYGTRTEGRATIEKNKMCVAVNFTRKKTVLWNGTYHVQTNLFVQIMQNYIWTTG